MPQPSQRANIDESVLFPSSHRILSGLGTSHCQISGLIGQYLRRWQMFLTPLLRHATNWPRVLARLLAWGLPLSRRDTANPQELSVKARSLTACRFLGLSEMARSSAMWGEDPDIKQSTWVVRPILIGHVVIGLNVVHSALTFCTTGRQR